MNPRLPTVSGREAVSAFQRAGWVVKRQKGSHIILRHPVERYTLSVPLHSSLKRGTLRSLIRRAGMTVEEFISLLP